MFSLTELQARGIKWSALITDHHSVDEHNAALEANETRSIWWFSH